ncbi:MAG TPA: BON domain-containing protein [Bryobacteraceae bacterium]
MHKLAGLLGLAAMLLIPAGLPAQQNGNDQTYESFIRGPEQAHLIKQVRHQLIMLPYYTIFDSLGFRVNGGNVTLEGAVTNPVLKSSAQNVTKSVEGVTNVVNNIKVLPVSPNDWRIRRAEYRAIYGDPALSARYCCQALPPIHIIVDSGHVTLEGVVQNQFDKNVVNVRAKSVPGVFSVVNNLRVENNGKNKKKQG